MAKGWVSTKYLSLNANTKAVKQVDICLNLWSRFSFILFIMMGIKRETVK